MTICGHRMKLSAEQHRARAIAMPWPLIILRPIATGRQPEVRRADRRGFMETFSLLLRRISAAGTFFLKHLSSTERTS